ncbi:TolC family protein [Cupriavidus pauculus]|uniref:TolC family protein n=1 Tax=Cupriavidus pauculus TaxID=82633 RepID=UPI003D815DC7
MRSFLLPLGLAAAWLSPIACPSAHAQDAPPSLATISRAAAAPQAEPAGLITLDAALALAAAQNPTLSAAQMELDASEGGIAQARVIRNPEVSVQMEDTRQTTRATTAQMNLPLELGGKRAARIDASQRAREVAQAQLSAAQADLRAAVIAAFFNVLIAQERVRLAAGSVDIATRGAQAAAWRPARFRRSRKPRRRWSWRMPAWSRQKPMRHWLPRASRSRRNGAIHRRASARLTASSMRCRRAPTPPCCATR